VLKTRTGTVYIDCGLPLHQAEAEGPLRLSLEAVSALRRLSEATRLVLVSLENTRDPSVHTLAEELASWGITAEAEEPAVEASPCAPSFMLSDSPDFFAKHRIPAALPIHLLTTRGLRNLDTLPPEALTFHTLKRAADWILLHPGGEEYLHRAVAEGAEALKRGELTAFPTETVYGLGANAMSEKAVEKIFAAKKRPLYDPLIVHIGDIGQLAPLVGSMPETARKLAQLFWPGPLTMVLPKSRTVPDLVTSGHPTVAVRMPSNPWARELIRRSGLPVAAPSANLFGRTSPTTAAHVEDQLAGSYAVLIDAGACRVGVESTVLSLAGDEPLLLRAGGVSREEIEAVIGPVAVRSAEQTSLPESPGMLPSHYAPLTPLKIVADVREFAGDPSVGCILYETYGAQFRGPTVQLSSDREAGEIAVHIYSALRELDGRGLRLIVAEWCPAGGVGTAVNDRLRKAAAPESGRV
jgi:L-threonylcarbamoyladenylate synthase